MSDELSKKLGLASTPTFAQEASIPPGEHFVLLDGVRGSFCLSQQDKLEVAVDPKSWAWSSGVLHHVTMTPDQVVVQRWDRTEVSRYTRRSVIEQLDRFYAHIAHSQPTTNRSLSKHAVESFARLRSNFSDERQVDALSAFLLLLGGMLESDDDSFAREHAEKVSDEFDLDLGAPSALKSVSPELVQHFMSGFRTPLLKQSVQIATLPSLMVRHAGALVFQEAHFELIQRGPSDLFGVPDPARVAAKTVSGVHFTPPGLARALVEQALDAIEPLPAKLTILDAACGSGSILYEALRTLRDRKFTGEIKLIGFDESAYAIQMTKFLLAAARRDWPQAKFSTLIERRDSLSDEPWPAAQIVLMNPPFVSLRDLNPVQRQALTQVLGTYAKGRPDLSMAFIQRGLHSLVPGGVLGTLLPAGVLSMTYAQAWRRHLLDDASVAFLAVFGELGLFRLATVETGCVVLRKGATGQNDMYRSLWVGEKKDATPEALRYLRKATAQGARDGGDDTWTLAEFPATSLWASANWRPSPQTLRRERENIADHVTTTVSSLFEVKQGALPAPRAAFIIRGDQWQTLREKERNWFRRVAENHNIRGGQVLPGSYIFYPKSPDMPLIDSEDMLYDELPTFKDHLLKFKPILEKRRGKKDRWWELGEDRKWLRVPSKKIVSSYFGQAGSFAYDGDGDHVVVQGYGWLQKWKSPRFIPDDDVFHAYVAIFNSAFFGQLLAEICPTVGGGQLNLSKRYSEQVYLPDLVGRLQSSATSDRTITELAFFGKVITDTGLSTAPRSKIEELVRSLYGL
jgi:hypothetical protein